MADSPERAPVLRVSARTGRGSRAARRPGGLAGRAVARPAFCACPWTAPYAARVRDVVTGTLAPALVRGDEVELLPGGRRVLRGLQVTPGGTAWMRATPAGTWPRRVADVARGDVLAARHLRPAACSTGGQGMAGAKPPATFARSCHCQRERLARVRFPAPRARAGAPLRAQLRLRPPPCPGAEPVVCVPTRRDQIGGAGARPRSPDPPPRTSCGVRAAAADAAAAARAGAERVGGIDTASLSAAQVPPRTRGPRPDAIGWPGREPLWYVGRARWSRWAGACAAQRFHADSHLKARCPRGAQRRVLVRPGGTFERVLVVGGRPGAARRDGFALLARRALSPQEEEGRGYHCS